MATALRTLSLATCLLGVAACQTDGVTPASTGYSIFFSPAAHVEELVAAGDLEGASKVYNEQKSFFARGTRTNHPAVAALAEGLGRELGAQALKAHSEIEGVAWPVDPAAWPPLKAALAEADRITGDSKRHSLLQEPAFRVPGLARLEQAAGAVRGHLDAAAAPAFAAYLIAEGKDFFADYPVELDGAAFLKTHQAAWLTRLAEASAATIGAFENAYGKRLEAAARTELGRRYYQAKLRETAPGAPSFQVILAALQATKDAGMAVDRVLGARVQLIEVTSRTLLKEGQIEFPLGIDVDLPFAADKAELEAAFGSPTAHDADILILLDVAVARNDRKIASHNRVGSEFRTGTRNDPNPQHPIVQAQVNQAQMNLQAVRIQNATSTCYGLVACLLQEVAKAAAESAAIQQVQEAMWGLAATPMTLTVPVYQPYSFNMAVIDAAKVATINYYVVDRLSKTYLRGTFDAREEKTFKVAYNIHDDDRNRLSQLSGTDKEDDVVKFEKAPVTVSLSDILSPLAATGAPLRPLPQVVEIRNEVLADKNKALAALRARTYEAIPRDDARFDAVTVVFHPGGGLGTGFYVRDDLVLTNYHVIEGSQFVEMKLHGGQETFGKIIARDIRLDLALIQVQARGRPAAFYTANQIPLGQTVEAIGHPKGLQFSITRGVISGLRDIESRYMQGGKKVRFLQTDVAINPGNSGGPLFLDGKVVGVNTQKLAATELEGLSFAVHYGEVLDFLEANGIKIRLGS
ncbi:MAG: S1C family serine protease [Pseudomonadota bacterium]